MEWLQLKYFQTVARLEHMTQAAEQLQIAQPSLSKTISRLEEAVGVPLFDRQGRQIRLNQFGRAYLERVNRVFRELEEGEREIREMAGLNRGSVKLGVSITSVLPELIGTFMHRHPQVRFKQLLGPTADMKKMLEEGDIDLCISSIAIEGPDLEWQALLNEQVYVAVSIGHPLAARDSVRLFELADEPFISMNAGFSFRDFMDAQCAQSGFRPSIMFEVDEPEGISHLVGQGLGVAFLPELGFRSKSRAHLKRVRIEDRDFRRSTGIAWSKKHYLSLAARQFREFIVERYSRMQEEMERPI